MALSPHLSIALLSTSQANKETTINDAINALARTRGTGTISIAGSGAFAMTTDLSRMGVVELTGVLTGNRSVQLASGIDSCIIINNTTGNFYVEVSYGGVSPIRVPRGCAVPVKKSISTSLLVYDNRDGNPLLPEFIVERITSTQSLTAATDTVVQFNSETLDVSGSFDSTTNYRFTAPAPGLYDFSATVEIEVTVAGTGNTNATIALRKNGTIVRRGDLIQLPAAAVTTQRVSARGLIQLATGDTVDVVVRQDQSGSTSRINHGSDKTFFFGRAVRLG